MLLSKPRHFGTILLFASILWGTAAAGRAQFGTKELTTVIPTSSFQPSSSAFGYFNEGFTYYQVTSGNPAIFIAPVDVPVGGRVNQVCALVRDDDAAGEVLIDFSAVELGGAATGPSVTALGSLGSGGSQTPHYESLCVAPPLNTTVRAFGDADGDHVNQYLSYRIAISLKASSNLAFGGAFVKWQRQQASAPVTNTFADVPTDFLFFRAIENLAAAGITGGCTPGNFCPNGNITRGEAAAFFAKALGLYFQQ
jgi:hypothetical protein